MSRAAGVVLAVSVALSGTACGSDGDPSTSVELATAGSPAPAPTAAERRAVTISTTGCGDASATTGSGVIIEQATVLTAAHVVVGATDVFVDGEQAVVYALDRTRDLALIKAPSVDAPGVELADVAAGDAVRVLGGATSGTADAVVERRLVIDVDDVRSTTRSTRSGFELDVAIAGGDSGAGVYDAHDRLVGVVFAVPSGRSAATFAVDSTEITALLASTGFGEHRCDPARSRLVGPADP